MKFEWDENKAQSNLEKHKISFELAKELFKEPTVLSFQDNRFEYGEIREVAIGELYGVCLYVVFTLRGNIIRIISARKASVKERKAYYEYFKRTANRNSEENEGRGN
ncbi:hypothetical protein cce_4948 [Crocosphaera subtropica ATCC 51142]|uniref:BrnT family toxin n=1 Tax=Crocosphaera subtropica (strain ATCC 51142 / BH68) TaxID=43989 RepID=B1X2D3_CROS5|nr:BrnT family toxin [Crocosphaera subtropica]ACB54294.1 hypothetical protein cce_4948 [Crocosphaera subtropica ATCC 51142]